MKEQDKKHHILSVIIVCYSVSVCVHTYAYLKGYLEIYIHLFSIFQMFYTDNKHSSLKII